METQERHFESSLVFWAWCEVGAVQRLLLLCTGFCHPCSCSAASVLCGFCKVPASACTAPARKGENHSWHLWKGCSVCLLVLDGSFETWVKTSRGSLLEDRDSQFFLSVMEIWEEEHVPFFWGVCAAGWLSKTNWQALVFLGRKGASRRAFGLLLVGIPMPMDWKQPWLWGSRVYGVRSPCAGSEGGLCCWVSFRRALESQDGVWPLLQIQVTRGSMWERDTEGWCFLGLGTVRGGNGKGPGMWPSV